MKIKSILIAATIFSVSFCIGIAVTMRTPLLRVDWYTDKKCRPERDADDFGVRKIDFIPDGIYIPTTFLPPGFRDIAYLKIVTRNPKEGRSVAMRPYGVFVTESIRGLSRVELSGREITFQTENDTGVSYRFVGRFREENEYNPELQIGSLTGKLTRIEKESPVDEIELDFYGPRGKYSP